MRVVDFLIFMLQAHGQSLQRLAALLGEERLLGLLESSGESYAGPATAAGGPGPATGDIASPIRAEWLEADSARTESSAYAELESAVTELNLGPTLEFHVWAYPHYRAFIESPLDLSSRIRTGAAGGSGGEAGPALVEEAVAQSMAWVRNLGLPEAILPQAERVAQLPWLRFRTEVLKRVGRRPLGAVN